MQSAHHATPEDGDDAASDARADEAAMFRIAVDHTPVGVGFASTELVLTYANARWRDLANYHGPLPASPEVMVDLVHPDDRDRVAMAFIESTTGGAQIRERVRVVVDNGDIRHLTLALCPILDQGLGYAIGLSEVTELVAAVDEVRKSEQRFKSVAGALPIGVYRADPSGSLIWSNDRLREMGSFYGADHTGSSIYRFIHPDDLADVQERARQAIHDKVPFEAQHRLIGEDGRVRWVISRSTPILDEHGRIVEHVGSLEDVTDLHLRSVGLAHLAAHDPLTGLPNRASIEELIGTLASKAPDTDDVGVVFLDLDGFKEVNDTYGHQAGDAVLIEVANRLDQVVRQGDTVGRYGGDEFVMVCPGVERSQTLEAVAARAQAAISATSIFDGTRHHAVGASVGTAIGPGAGSVDDLLHRADLAMYQAKRGKERGDPAAR